MSSSRIPPTGFLSPTPLGAMPYYDSSSSSGIYKSPLPRRKSLHPNDPSGVMYSDEPETAQVELPVELQRQSWVKKIEKNTLDSDGHGHGHYSAFDESELPEGPPPGHEKDNPLLKKASMFVNESSGIFSPGGGGSTSDLTALSKGLKGTSNTSNNNNGRRKSVAAGAAAAGSPATSPKLKSKSSAINFEDLGAMETSVLEHNNSFTSPVSNTSRVKITVPTDDASVSSPKAAKFKKNQSPKNSIGESMKLVGEQSGKYGAPIQWVSAGTMVGHFRPKYEHVASGDATPPPLPELTDDDIEMQLPPPRRLDSEDHPPGEENNHLVAGIDDFTPTKANNNNINDSPLHHPATTNSPSSHLKLDPSAKSTDFIQKVGYTKPTKFMGFAVPPRAKSTEPLKPYLGAHHLKKQQQHLTESHLRASSSLSLSPNVIAASGTPSKATRRVSLGGVQPLTSGLVRSPQPHTGGSSSSKQIGDVADALAATLNRSNQNSRGSVVPGGVGGGKPIMLSHPMGHGIVRGASPTSKMNLTNGTVPTHTSGHHSHSHMASESRLASTIADLTAEEDEEELMIQQLIANSPRRFQVPDWSAMDPYTSNERGIIEELSRCRSDPPLYAEGLEKKVSLKLPVDMMDEPTTATNGGSPASPGLSPAKSHASEILNSNNNNNGTAAAYDDFSGSQTQSTLPRVEVNGVPAALKHIEQQQQALERMAEAREAQLKAQNEEDDDDPKKKKKPKAKPLSKKAGETLVGEGDDENEFAEGNVRILAKQRHIERLQQCVVDSTTFLDKLKTTPAPLPRAGYNRGLTLAAREIAHQIGQQGRRPLPLHDQLAQFGKLTGEISEFVLYGVQDPLQTVEEVVSAALKAGDDKVLLYPTKLYAGAGWQRHATRGAVTVILLASGFQEISYIKKHRNLPIVELKRCMSLGQMSADERLYDLNFIPEHYGIKALRPVAHPVVCGACVELVLQCPPSITLSCATESAGGEGRPSLTHETTFVDRIGKTAKVHAVMLECKPCKLIVYARHPNELVFKKASTILLRPVKSLWKPAEAQPFPDQLEQFQMLQGELVTPRSATLKDNGTAVTFVIRLLGNSRSATLRGSHGTTHLMRSIPHHHQVGGASPQSVLSPNSAVKASMLSQNNFNPNNTGGYNSISGADGLGENVCVNKTSTTYSTSLVVKAGPLSLWIDELSVLRWNVI